MMPLLLVAAVQDLRSKKSTKFSPKIDGDCKALGLCPCHLGGEIIIFLFFPYNIMYLRHGFYYESGFFSLILFPIFLVLILFVYRFLL